MVPPLVLVIWRDESTLINIRRITNHFSGGLSSLPSVSWSRSFEARPWLDQRQECSLRIMHSIKLIGHFRGHFPLIVLDSLNTFMCTQPSLFAFACLDNDLINIRCSLVCYSAKLKIPSNHTLMLELGINILFSKQLTMWVCLLSITSNVKAKTEQMRKNCNKVTTSLLPATLEKFTLILGQCFILPKMTGATVSTDFL